MRIESFARATFMKAVVKEYDINGSKVKGYQLMLYINDDAENVKCSEDVYNICMESGLKMGTDVEIRLDYNTDPSVKKNSSLRITGIRSASDNTREYTNAPKGSSSPASSTASAEPAPVSPASKTSRR